MLKAICGHLNSLSIFALIGVIVIVATLIIRSNLQTAEEAKQIFENRLLARLAGGNSIIVHNQGVIIKNDGIKNHNEEIIIHNQLQFARYGFGDISRNYTTPDIRTDFQRTTTDYWNNYTTPK